MAVKKAKAAPPPVLPEPEPVVAQVEEVETEAEDDEEVENDEENEFEMADFTPEIEQNVPIPQKVGRRFKKHYEFPFNKILQMEPGDSLFIPKPDDVPNISPLKQFAEKHIPDSVWITRRVPDAGGFRIWRIE